MTVRLLAGLAVLLAAAGCSLPAAPSLRSSASGLADGLPVPPGAQEAVVVRITDGDTVRLRGRGVGPVPPASTLVRILLVDTPEVHRGADCYGPEAAQRLGELLPVGSSVRVQPDADLEDRYDRLLLHVWNADGLSVGEVLLAEGYATVLQVDPNRRHLARFQQREQLARAGGRGLWSACANG